VRSGLVLRIARPTDHLTTIATMYAEGLRLMVLGQFTDHDGFDGVILGHVGGPFHIEFTTNRARVAGTAPSDEHLLVFYEPDPNEWARGCDRLIGAGFRAVPSANPYWDREGRTFEDADGYRIVLQNAARMPDSRHGLDQQR
jgi:hypothetical protein